MKNLLYVPANPHARETTTDSLVLKETSQESVRELDDKAARRGWVRLSKLPEGERRRWLERARKENERARADSS